MSPFSPGQEKRYRRLLGDDFEAFKEACRRPLSPVIRCNTLKTEPRELFCLLKNEGFVLSPLPWCPYAFRVVDGPVAGLGNTLEHFAGLFYMQEEVSLLPVVVLDPLPGELLLDLAAAPGSKTTQAAQQMKDRGAIVANDVSGDRLKALAYHVERLGITSVTVTQMDGRRCGRLTPATFHRVIADCPCSGEGTIRKDSRAVNEPSPDARRRLVETQKALLVSAYKAVRPGGLILYSTCTLAPEENEGVVSYLLERYQCRALTVELPGLVASPGIPGWYDEEFHPQVANSLRLYPHQNDTGGFFLSLLKREE